MDRRVPFASFLTILGVACLTTSYGEPKFTPIEWYNMEKKVNWNISLLRILATLGVVYMHTNTTILFNPQLFVMSDNQAFFFRCGHEFFLWTVPVFFMITGYLLLDSEKDLDYPIVLKKYVLRVFLALTLFSLPFAVLKIYGESHCVSVVEIFKAYIGNESLSHLWYLYALIGLYLISPVLKKGLKNLSESSVAVFLVFLLLFDFVLPMLSKLTGVKIAFEMPVAYPVFYFVAGYYCKKIVDKESLKQNKLAIALLAGFAFVVFLIGSNHYAAISDNYWSPLIALLSVALFLFVIKNKEFHLNDKWKPFFWKIDRLCFAVYLIHPIFIQSFYRRLNWIPLSFEWWPLFTVLFFLCFALLSFLAASIIVKIPGLRKILF